MKRETRRVPSANLSRIEVVGDDESTTRPIDGDGAAVKKVAPALGSEMAEAGVTLLPKVLPTPWKEERRFGGSWTKEVDKGMLNEDAHKN